MKNNNYNCFYYMQDYCFLVPVKKHWTIHLQVYCHLQI